MTTRITASRPTGSELFRELLDFIELREVEGFVQEGKKIPDLLPHQGSDEAELLKRMERLAVMGCPVNDLEYLIAEFCRFYPGRHADVSRLVLGPRGEVMLNVR